MVYVYLAILLEVLISVGMLFAMGGILGFGMVLVGALLIQYNVHLLVTLRRSPSACR